MARQMDHRFRQGNVNWSINAQLVSVPADYDSCDQSSEPESGYEFKFRFNFVHSV